LVSSLHASAFCVTRGCNEKKETCEYDEHQCLQTGPLLHWASSCVSFDVQRDGSALRGISYDDAHTAITEAFGRWLSADCGGGTGPLVTINDKGAVECRKAEYNQDAPNANIIMFRDEKWPYENAIDTLALTTLIFNADSGEIYDADIEVNTFQSAMALANVGPEDIDFASVITHEVGHFLGLSHSDVQGATMRPSYAPGQTSMSSIEQDDIDGICTALPANRALTSDSCTPRHGFASACAVPESSCAVAPGGGGEGRALGSLLFAFVGLSSRLLRRRLRPSSRQA
jgi:hypothetical protein